MKRKVISKVVSAVCIVLLIIGTLYLPIQVSADNSSVSCLTFEDYPYDTSTRLVFGRCLSIDNSADVGNGDDYALRWMLDGDKPCVDDSGESLGDELLYVRANQRDHIATVGQVENGCNYRVTFDYKSDVGCTDNYKIRLVTNHQLNIWYKEWKAQTEKFDVVADNTDWQTHTFIFNANTIDTANTLYIEFTCEDANYNTYINALVDNIRIEKLTDSVVYYHSGIGGVKDTVVIGKAGDPLTTPEAFLNSRTELLGLYTDEALTVPFTSSVIPEGTTHVYAKWGATTLSFEDYPYNTSSSVTFGKLLSIENTEGIGVDDDYALRWVLDGDKEFDTINNGTIRYQYQVANLGLHHCFIIADNIENQAYYKVTYSYKVLSATSSVTFGLASAIKNNAWGYPTTYDTASYSVYEANAQWQQAESYFLASPQEMATALYFTLSTKSIGEDTYAEVLIDNAKVEKIEKPAILFDPCNNEAATLKSGSAGDPIELPSPPTAFGKVFNGWYTDEECTVPFTDTTFKEDTYFTVYAGYVPANRIVYSYESFTFGSGYYVIGDAQILTFDKAKSGTKAVLFDRTQEYNSGGSYIAIAHDNEIFEIDPSKKYSVTVHYYVEEAAFENLSMSIIASVSHNFWAGKNASMVVGSEAEILSSFALENQGKWMSVTFDLNTDIMTESNFYDRLYFAIQGGENWKIWIDDITVNTVAEESTVAGDVTGDGVTDTTDLANLKLYLAGQDIAVNPIGSDLDNDGLVTTGDLATLKLYLASGSL